MVSKNVETPAQAAAMSDSKRRGASDPPAALLAAGLVRRDLATASGNMAYYEGGEGEPLVFLHGIGGGASSWTWVFVAPAFIASHRVVVPDWIGWGESGHPDRYVVFDDYVAALERLLESLGRPAIVVAQSLAAGFAMALAERRPDLVSRFILNTPSGGMDFGKNAFGPLARATVTPIASLPVINFAFYRALFHRRTFIGGWLRQQGFHDPALVTPEIVDAFVFNARKPRAAWSALPFATGKLRFDLVPYLKRMTKPATMFWGAEESQVGVAQGRRLAALRPNVQLTLIADAAACPELERPAAVISAIRQGLTA